VIAFVESAMAVSPDDRPQDLNALHDWAAPCDPALVASE